MRQRGALEPKEILLVLLLLDVNGGECLKLSPPVLRPGSAKGRLLMDIYILDNLHDVNRA